MNEQRKSEIARREEAHAHAGDIVAGSGRRGKPRRMAQMVSVRLDGELVAELRTIAQERNTTISDLLREGAALIVQGAYADAIKLNFDYGGVTGPKLMQGWSGRQDFALPFRYAPSGRPETTTKPLEPVGASGHQAGALKVKSLSPKGQARPRR